MNGAKSRLTRAEVESLARVVAGLLAAVLLTVSTAPRSIAGGAILLMAVITVVEVRRDRARRRVATRARLAEMQHRHETSVAQSRMLRDWMVRQRHFLDAVVTSMHAGVIAVNSEGAVTTANRTAAFHLGAESLEVGTSIDAGLGIVHEQLTVAVCGSETPTQEFVACGSDGIDRSLSIDARPVTSKDGSILGAVAAIHDVTHLRSTAEEMTRLAMVDSLTGLPNRSLLLDRLDRALARTVRSGLEVAVMFIDLNGFKGINDTYGHKAGDLVLTSVARRIRQTIRPADTVARLGGDEFVVVCEGPGVASEARHIADRIADRTGEPVELPNDEVVVGSSIGIVVGDASCHDAAALLAAADEAMYAAKQRGMGNHIEVFDHRSDVMATREAVEIELHEALLHSELHVDYQTVTDLTTGGVVGVEALVRWEHPNRGRLAPAEFLPAAERSGLIVPMGRAVLAEGCELVVTANRGASHPPLDLYVNMSTRQILDRRLCERIREQLDRSGLPPERLCLEIRELDLAMITPRAATAMAEVADLGVRFAVDDFGSGPASVTALRRHPISVIKIDRGHIANICKGDEPEAFVRAVIELAGNLDIDVIAEGVETTAQRDRLVALGCTTAQGFLFAAPQPPSDVAALRAGLGDHVLSEAR